jgi:hypothetical protein
MSPIGWSSTVARRRVAPDLGAPPVGIYAMLVGAQIARIFTFRLLGANHDVELGPYAADGSVFTVPLDLDTHATSDNCDYQVIEDVNWSADGDDTDLDEHQTFSCSGGPAPALGLASYSYLDLTVPHRPDRRHGRDQGLDPLAAGSNGVAH